MRHSFVTSDDPNISRFVLLTDTGPLVALSNAQDEAHDRCQAALMQLGRTGQFDFLCTTWACLTETVYLLQRERSPLPLQGFWRLRDDGFLRVIEQRDDEVETMRDLMARYADAPMDFADASIVVAAETLGTRRVFTLDSHFYAYRTASGESFEVIP